MNMIIHMEGPSDDELAFFLDLAMNECQRWLEVTCRELFIDSDDFVYSLRHGSHLRKIINKIIPDCFDLPREHYGKNIQTTHSVLRKAGVPYTELEQYIGDEDWISQLLLVCIYRLRIPRHLLFVREDLDCFEDHEKPYKAFIEEQLTSVLGKTSKCENYDNVRIRRLCCTISALFDACARSAHVPQLDPTALESLLQYHESTCRNFPDPSLLAILDRPTFDVVHVVSTLVEQVCFADELSNRIQLNTPSSDEGVGTMMDYNYTMKKYLADLNSEYSTEEMSSYSAGTNGSRSGSPYTSERSSATGDRLIPTRQQLRLTSQVAHNPLQFVAARSAATALSEKAKQQLTVTEQQKRIREELRKNMYNDEDEASWQTNLNSWLTKRKTAIARWKDGTTDSVNPALNRNGTGSAAYGQTEEQQQKQQMTSGSTSLYPEKEREECLTLSSPSPLEDHQEDSGIENNYRSSSIDGHSPANSLDFFPSNEINQSGPRNSSSSLSSSSQNHCNHHHHHQHQNLRLSPSIPLFLEKSFTNSANCCSANGGENDRRAASITNLLRTDTVGRSVSQNTTEQSHSRSVTPQADSYRAYPDESSDSDSDFPAPPDNLLRAAGFAHSQPTIATSSNMKSNSSNSSSPTLKREPLSPLTRKRTTDSSDAVSLGIELCREQSANITAVKFPVKRQISAACHNCKVSTDDVNGGVPNEVDPISKSKQVSSPFIPYTSATLSSLQARGHLGTNIDGVHPRTSPKGSRSTRFTNEAAIPKSQLKTVDIQFEDKPSAAYQPSNIERNTSKMSTAGGGVGGIIDVNIDLGQIDGSNSERKHFGFTVSGGKDKNAPLKIDAVIVGTPADEAGLQVGDLLMSINGESVTDRYYQSVIRMLHEAERLGEVELRIQRSDTAVAGPRTSAQNYPLSTDQRSTISFDQKRAMFDEKCITKDGYKEFWKQKQGGSVHKWSGENSNKRPENAAPTVATPTAVTVMRSNSAISSTSALDDDQQAASVREKLAGTRHHPRERFSSRASVASSTSCSVTGSYPDPDYRVTSLHDKPKPGKLADFIPEVERKAGTGASFDHDDGASAYSSSFSRRGSDVDGTLMSANDDDGEAPRVLRNYDVTPVRSVTTSPIQHKISYWMKKDEQATMSLPRNVGTGEYRRNGFAIQPHSHVPVTTNSTVLVLSRKFPTVKMCRGFPCLGDNLAGVDYGIIALGTINLLALSSKTCADIRFLRSPSVETHANPL